MRGAPTPERQENHSVFHDSGPLELQQELIFLIKKIHLLKPIPQTRAGHQKWRSGMPKRRCLGPEGHSGPQTGPSVHFAKDHDSESCDPTTAYNCKNIPGGLVQMLLIEYTSTMQSKYSSGRCTRYPPQERPFLSPVGPQSRPTNKPVDTVVLTKFLQRRSASDERPLDLGPAIRAELQLKTDPRGVAGGVPKHCHLANTTTGVT